MKEYYIWINGVLLVAWLACAISSYVLYRRCKKILQKAHAENERAERFHRITSELLKANTPDHAQ